MNRALATGRVEIASSTPLLLQLCLLFSLRFASPSSLQDSLFLLSLPCGLYEAMGITEACTRREGIYHVIWRAC